MRTRRRFMSPAVQPSPECLFLGPVRAVADHKANDIRIETTADHPAGFGLIVARLPKSRMAEARAIVALPDLLKAAPGFAAYGRMLEAQDPATPLFTAAGLEIAAGDMQAMAAAYDRALGPAGTFRSAAPASSKEPRPQNKP